MPDTIEPTGDDAIYAHITFESGAVGQWIDDHAGHGLRKNERARLRLEGLARDATATATAGRSRCTWTTAPSIDDERILEYAPELPARPAGGRAVRRRARLDLRASTFNDIDSQHHRARVLRAGRVHPHRRRARGDRRGGPRRRRADLRAVRGRAAWAGRSPSTSMVAGRADVYQREIDEHPRPGGPADPRLTLGETPSPSPSPAERERGAISTLACVRERDTSQP